MLENIKLDDKTKTEIETILNKALYDKGIIDSKMYNYTSHKLLKRLSSAS